MLRRSSLLAAVGVAAVAAACASDPLSVTNKNAPTVDALLGSATGTQTLDSKLFQFAFNGQYGSSDDIWDQTQVMAGESEATVANFGMNIRGSYPRAAIDNTPGNAVLNGNFADFSALTRTSRQASLVIAALKNYTASYDAGTAARNGAFAYFALGYALGNLSLIYDSVEVITPASRADSLPAFTAAPAAMPVALAMLDTAAQIASSSAATVAVPAAWMSTTADVPMTTFARLARSYKAKFRAGVARTPAEGDAVDWNAVATDAQAGITSDFILQLNSGTNWVISWLNQALVGASWHQMPMWVIGMADTTGAYTTWLASANASKVPFLIRTPDRRFPSGETRDAQIAQTNPDAAPTDSVRYFRSRRPGSDSPGGPTNGSYYDNFRFLAYRLNNLSAPWPLFTRAESDMLAAEALMRTGRLSAALPLVDRYRVRANLPPMVGTVTSATTPVPGGNACVPRFPTRTGSSFTLSCANAYEAMKYEKRLEGAFTGFAVWYVDARRWGDLISGTPLEWPVPYQETNARNLPVPQNRRVSTATNTYGWTN